MSKPTQEYLHACQRAELLGQPAPSEEEWLNSEKERMEREEDQHDDAVAEELESNDEGMRRIGGGLDELTNILSETQKKINRFKNVCGSLGTLLKARVSSRHGTPEHKVKEPGDPLAEGDSNTIGTSENNEDIDETLTSEIDEDGSRSAGGANSKKQDISYKMGSHLNKLDSLISKAENAQYSMQHQTKQMKSLLK